MQKEMTFWEKVEAIRILSIFPALTVIALYRKRCGLRTMQSSFIGWMALIVITLGKLGHDSWLVLYGCLVFIAGTWQRWNRWRELKRGDTWHTYSRGISPLEYLHFLPAVLVEDRRLHRFGDPLVLLAFASLVSLVDKPLGLWIAFSAMSLRIFEEYSYHRTMTRLLDQYDSMIVAESDQAFMRLAQSGATPAHTPRGENTIGNPDFDDDLCAKLKERLAEASARAEARRQEEATAPADADGAHSASAAPIVVLAASHTETVRERMLVVREEPRSAALPAGSIVELSAEPVGLLEAGEGDALPAFPAPVIDAEFTDAPDEDTAGLNAPRRDEIA